MSCEHVDVEPVFEHSAVCLDCGDPLCRNCLRRDCRVEYWQHVDDTGAWRGVATSDQDARQALGSARMLCEFNAAYRHVNGPQFRSRLSKTTFG